MQAERSLDPTERRIAGVLIEKELNRGIDVPIVEFPASFHFFDQSVHGVMSSCLLVSLILCGRSVRGADQPK